MWTRLGVWGMDSDDAANRKMVHAFVDRDSDGLRIEDTWDSLGMRATRSYDTVLEGAFVPLERIPRIVPSGAAGMDIFLLGMYAWALSGFANVYFGVAKRAFELAVESIQNKKSIAVGSGSYAHHPGYQLALADLAILCNAIEPHIDSVADGYAESVRDAANWGPEVAPRWAERIVSLKKMTTEQSFQVVDGAVEIVGGYGVSRHSELERLFRDSRMGRIHPANSFMTREFVSKIVLGLDFDAQPRWG
jgi:alkylation response protein AidB-like acyl-CoA dehydrogenase